MWQEARKQEKYIRGMMVDYRRRAERRKGFYDKIKKDPAEFLQIWGTQMKINIESSSSNGNTSNSDGMPIMTKWRGDEEVLIDRFDVRSHLDYLEEYKSTNDDLFTGLSESEKNEERMLNYERYRTLVQNDAAAISEQQVLKQIELEEKYGELSVVGNNYHASQMDKKTAAANKAQIGYNYEENAIGNKHNNNANNNHHKEPFRKSPSPDLFDLDNDDDLDLQVDVTKLTSEEKTILNKHAIKYGMESGDFVRMLIIDHDEKEAIKQNKLLEAEKAQYSGRKSRRERRLAKEKRLKERGELSPLSYVMNESPKGKSKSSDSSSSSRSRSRSNSRRTKTTRKTTSDDKKRRGDKSPSESANKVLFITSFGDQDEESNDSHKSEPTIPATNNNSQTLPITPHSNLKRLKENLNSSLRRSSSSRSRSRSPALNFSKSSQNSKSGLKENDQSQSSSSSESSSSDEEKALENYLKRREYRKQTLNDDRVNVKQSASDLQKDLPFKYSNEIIKKNNYIVNSNETNANSNNNNNNNNNDKNNDNSLKITGSSSSKFASAEQFKLHQEKLKKKMQNEINKQLKKDQKLEKERRKKEREERREREAQIMQLTEKINERRRKERRKNRDTNNDHDYSTSRSRSRSRSTSRSRSRSRSDSRSRRRYRHRSSSSDSRHGRTYKRDRNHSRSSSSDRARTKQIRSDKYRKRTSSRSTSRSSSRSRIHSDRKRNRNRSNSKSRSSSRRRRSSSTSSSSSYDRYKTKIKRSRSRSRSSSRSRSRPNKSDLKQGTSSPSDKNPRRNYRARTNRSRSHSN